MGEQGVPLVRRREGVGGLAVGLLLAIALHALLFPLLPALVKGAAHDGGRGARLVRLSHAQWDKNRRIELKLQQAKPAQKDEPKKKEDDDTEPPGQVVTLPPPDKEERPDFATHASEWNQKVARETRSRDQRPDAPAITHRLTKGMSGAREAMVAPQGEMPAVPADASSGPAGPGRSRTGDSGTDASDGRGQRLFALEVPRQAAREPLQLRVDVDGILKNRTALPEIPGNGETARLAMGNTPADRARRAGGSDGDDAGQGLRGGGNGTAGLPGLAALTPTPQELAKLAGAPANDYLPDVEVDAETRLNAWRWKHATFFNRIAEKIRHEWQGGEVLTHTDPQGNVYGFEDRMTVVQVTIDRSGNVLEVNVEEPSGAVVLDDEAVRAFKKAGPFANPPPQLFKGANRFRFLFGFNVSYNRTNFDLNWRPD